LAVYRLISEAIPEGSWDPESPDYSEESSRAWDKFLEEWYDNLGSVVEQLVPEKLRRRPTSPGWQEFVAACTLYQPPDAELRKFADWGMPGESIIMHPSPSTDIFERRGMVLPPIRQLPDPHEERMLVARYWQEILETVWQVYVEPQGITFGQMILTALNSEHYHKAVQERNSKKPQTGERRYYIEVDEFTSESDVRHAASMLFAAQEDRPRAGRRNRDRLTCVECAILHDRHGWDYERLAQRYGWKESSNVVSKYIADGRQILEEQKSSGVLAYMTHNPIDTLSSYGQRAHIGGC